MPGKSRRKRGKHVQTSKIKSRQHVAQAVEVGTSNAEPGPVFRNVAEPKNTVATRTSSSHEIIQHPYITTELRTIGILAALTITILFVLYIVLT